MKSRFPGFPKEGLEFLRDLQANNNRDWFNARKPVFEEKVRLPMIELVQALNEEMTRFAPDYVREPAKGIYRIYRDTRFSKDKTPYKTYIATLFWHRGLGKDYGAAMFFLVSPAKIEVAGGLYKPQPEQLLAVRQHIAENTREFRKTFENPAVKKLLSGMEGERISRPPKGFDPDHPAIELLKHKQFILRTSFDGATAGTPKLFRQVLARLEAMAPVVKFIDAPLVGKQRQEFRI